MTSRYNTWPLTKTAPTVNQLALINQPNMLCVLILIMYLFPFRVTIFFSSPMISNTGVCSISGSGVCIFLDSKINMSVFSMHVRYLKAKFFILFYFHLFLFCVKFIFFLLSYSTLEFIMSKEWNFISSWFQK